MEKIKPLYVWLAVAVVLVAAGFLLYRKGTPAPAPSQEQHTATGTAPMAQESKPTLPSSTKGPQRVGPPASPPIIPISFLSPLGGDKWVMGEAHVIAWSAATGYSGGVYLLDAATKQLVGWILAGAGEKQTSYAWDTRDVSTTRTGGTKANLQSGSYIIRITFDGKRPDIQSAPFSIIQPSQAEIPVRAVTIKDFAFMPKTLTVNRGDKVVFTNNDAVPHRVVSTSFGPYLILSGESVTLDTSRVTSGSYTYYCDIHPSMAPATLIIK